MGRAGLGLTVGSRGRGAARRGDDHDRCGRRRSCGRCLSGGGGACLLDGLPDLRESAQEREIHQQRQRSDGPEHPGKAGTEEGPHAGRVQLRPGDVRELAAGSTYRHRPLVAARRGHHLEDVGHRDDPAREGDVMASETPRIAEPVEPFVVLLDGSAPVAEPLEQRARHRRASGRVAPHDLPLGRVQRGRLVEDPRRHVDLAEVVQQGGPAQAVAGVLRQMQLLREDVGEDPDPFGVTAGAPVVRAQRRQQSEDACRGLAGRLARTRPCPLLEHPRVAHRARQLEARGRPVGKEHGHAEQRREGEHAPQQPLGNKSDGDGEDAEREDPRRRPGGRRPGARRAA